MFIHVYNIGATLVHSPTLHSKIDFYDFLMKAQINSLFCNLGWVENTYHKFNLAHLLLEICSKFTFGVLSSFHKKKLMENPQCIKITMT